MNILIVDDEAYVLDVVKRNLPWGKLKIDSVNTVRSVKQAKEYILTEDIDIIISDIVMPQETGLELAEWVREAKGDIPIIFLSSYQEFHYAKRAIELEGLEYILKPNYASIYDAVLKAAKRVERRSRVSDGMEQKFLAELCDRTEEPKAEQIWEEVNSLSLSFHEEDVFLPVQIYLDMDSKTAKEWKSGTVTFLIRNVLEELLEEKKFQIKLIKAIGERKFNLIFDVCQGDEKQLFQIMEEFTQWFRSKTKILIWCGVSEKCALHEIPKGFTRLKELRNQNVSFWGCYLPVKEAGASGSKYDIPLTEIWMKLLDENKVDDLKKSITKYLEKMDETEGLSLEVLKRFRADFMQLIYGYLSKYEVRAHLLYVSEESEQFYDRCIQSCSGAKECMKHYLDKAVGYTEFASEEQTVVQTIKTYIDNHYQEEINRNQLSRIVFLNPDYISRIFKKEMGISISTYLLQKRISVAKDLLKNSNLTISKISIYIGYPNFSYFTKMFRENVGCSPIQYRKEKQNETSRDREAFERNDAE